jgi:hypothetical protein
MVAVRPLLASRGRAGVGEERIWRGMAAGRQRSSGYGQAISASGVRRLRWSGRLRGKRWWLVVVAVGSRRLVVVGWWWPDPLFSSSGSLPVATLRWNRVLPMVARQIW